MCVLAKRMGNAGGRRDGGNRGDLIILVDDECCHTQNVLMGSLQ